MLCCLPKNTNETFPYNSQRTPSFLTLPKLNMSRLSPTRGILSPLSRLSPRLKRKFNTVNSVNGVDNKSKIKGDQSSPTPITPSMDSGDTATTDEPDFNYAMNILLQQEDGRKNRPKKNRLMQAISSIPRSSRKIYKKFSSADDNISIASKMSSENTDVLLSQVLGVDNGVAVDDSFDLSSSSSSTSSTSSSSSCTLPQFEPLIYNYEHPEPIIDLSNIKHFPRRNSDYSDEVNCILNEKYGENSMEVIGEKREREERARRIADRSEKEIADRKSDEELYRKIARENERVHWPEKIDPFGEITANGPHKESPHEIVRDSNAFASKHLEHKLGDLLNQTTDQKLGDQESPKTRKVSMFEGNLLEPNRENSGRRYSDASQLSPQGTNQMTRRHSSSDIQDRESMRGQDTRKSFETVYGRRLSDLPDLVTVKMSEKKRPPTSTKQQKPSPKPVEKSDGETENNGTKNRESVTDCGGTNEEPNKNTATGSKNSGNISKHICAVQIKVDEVISEANSKEDNNNDVTQQITDSFSFLDSRGTPPMSEMEQVECGEENNSHREKFSVDKETRPYLSKNRIAYKETIFTPRSEMMLTVTEPSFDSSSSRQVSFDTDTSHDDLVLESSKEEIEFTGSHFLDSKPKLSKSYENLSSLNDKDLSPERSFSLANLSDDGSREKKAADRSKKINALESFPGPPPLKTLFCDPAQGFGRPLDKLSEEGDSLSDEDGRNSCLRDQETSPENVSDSNVVSDHGDSSPTSNKCQKLPDESSNSRERNNARSNGGFSSSTGNNENNGGDDGDDNPNRNHRQVPQDKQNDEEQEEDDREKTPPLSRMSPVVFGDEDNSNVVNFLSYNVTKSGGLVGVDRFENSNSPYQMSLMNMTDVSRSNPNLSSDTKVRLTPRDKARSMFDLVIVSNEPDKSSHSSRRSSVKKNGKMFRRRESKSAENISRTNSDRKMSKQPVLSDENLQNNNSEPAQPLARRDSVFARRKISLTNDNRRESKSNGNLTESVENLASTLLTRRGSINLNRNNSISRKMSLTGKGKKPLEEQESYESVSGSVLMRRDSVKRMPEGRLKKQNSLRNELDRQQSQSSENIRPYTNRDPFGDHLMRTSSVTSVSEYRETLRKLLKSQESIEEINESESAMNRTNGDKKMECQSLVNITEQLEGDEHLNKSDSNIHKMIAVPKPTSILKKKIDFVPIPADATKQKKEHNQSKVRNFFGEDIDLNSIESDAKSRHEPSPSSAPYSRIIANREDPLESRYSHIIANRVIVKPKQPAPETKIQNGNLLRRCQPPPPPQHLKSNDYLVQKDFTTPVRLPNIDYIDHRENSVDSTIVSEEVINSPLKFTDFKNHDPVMKKLLSESKKKAENELDLVLGESSDQNEDPIEFVTQFIDAEIKANILQRCKEGEKPLSVSVPSIESVSLKTQNFTAKFIETERDACETQRIKGQDKKKKSVLILKSTEPNFNTMENTFIISAGADDEALLRSKLIQEEEHPTTPPRRLSKTSITPTRRFSKTSEYTDTQRRLSKTSQYSYSEDAKTSTQQITAEFIEREKVYSAFQQPHLILIKKFGDKNAPPPISDGLKTESKIKDELEKTSKFLQMERQFSSIQAQAIVKLVKKSLDSINFDSETLKQAITSTMNFIENEKKFITNTSIDSYKSSSVPRGSNELKSNIQPKKSPSKEKEKRSPSKKKRPTQEEIDMILKRQSYDFALSKMNMTGVVPDINTYRFRPSRDEESSSFPSQIDRSEPNYAYIISQSSFNKHGYQKSNIQQFKSERSRLSAEEVLYEENVKPCSEEQQKTENLPISYPELDSNIEIKDSNTPHSLHPSEESSAIESNKNLHEKSPTAEDTSSVDISEQRKNESEPIRNETEHQTRESSEHREKNMQMSREESNVIDTPNIPIDTPDSRDETNDTFCGGERPVCEESIEESEPSIVNFFSASMETIKSRHTGHSDDFSDFAESVESVPEETCDQLADTSEQTDGVETNRSNQSFREDIVQETCEAVVHENATVEKNTVHEICLEEAHNIELVEKNMIQETCDEEVHEVAERRTEKITNNISPNIENLDWRQDGFLEPKETNLQALEEEATNSNSQTETLNSSASNNESVLRNGDMVDNNLSPKSSASEVLSDSTIDNQLNECKNCRHPKIDSLDFLSDEDLKSSLDHARDEVTVGEQLETLEAEMQRTNGNIQHVVPSLELKVETREYESEEQMILEDKSDDKSPDLVVTQGTSGAPDVESFTPVAAPRTKKKKKKKHQASKEDLNLTTETKVDETAKSEMTILSGQEDRKSIGTVENVPEKANVQDEIDVVSEQSLFFDEHVQVNVDSQEDSDSKSKPRKKRKRKLTITKATKEDHTLTDQIEQKETAIENKNIHIEVQESVPEVCPLIANDGQETKATEIIPDANTQSGGKTLKKKKAKLSRHPTQDLSAMLKPEILIDVSEAETHLNIPPPEIFSDDSHVEVHTAITNPETIVEEPDVCPETCEDIPDQPEEDWYRLDEVCEPMPEEEVSNKYVEETCPCEDTVSDETCPSENTVDSCSMEHTGFIETIKNGKPSDTCPVQETAEVCSPGYEVIDETCSEEYSTDVVLNESENTVCPEEHKITEVCPDDAQPNATAVDPDETKQGGHQRDSQEISLTSPGPCPVLQGTRRVNINTGLDVINSRLDVINQEISTIAHVLSNINQEIKQGSSTVELDVPLDISERERVLHGRKSRPTTSSLPNVLNMKQQHEFCCEKESSRRQADDSNEIFKSLGTVVVKGFSAKGARLFDKGPSTGSQYSVQSEVQTALVKENVYLDKSLSSAIVESDQIDLSKQTGFVDKDSPSANVNNDVQPLSFGASANSVTNASLDAAAGSLTPLVCDANLAPSPSHVLVSALRAPEDPVASAEGAYESSAPGASTPSKLTILTSITRRSSESDLSITPKGKTSDT